MENKKLPVKKMYIDRYKYTPSSIVFLPKEKINGLIPFAKVYYDEDDTCEILTQEISLGLLSIFTHNFNPKQDLILLPFAARHIITLHNMKGEKITVCTYDGVMEELEPNYVGLYNLEAKYNVAEVKKGMKFDSIHININIEKIPVLVNKHPELSFLLQDKVLKVKGRINKEAYLMNDISRFCLKNILTCGYVGKTAKFFLYSQALMLLVSFANRYHYEEELRQMPDQEDKDIIRACYAHIKENACEHLSLWKLAEQFDIPAGKLQTGFLAIYGLRIRDFQLMVRMDLAFKTLCKGCNLHQVAKNTGYTSIDKFCKIFRCYFGCSPEYLNNVQ